MKLRELAEKLSELEERKQEYERLSHLYYELGESSQTSVEAAKKYYELLGDEDILLDDEKAVKS